MRSINSIYSSIDLLLAKTLGNPNHSMPLEGILRPAYEYNTAIIAFFMSIFFFNAALLRLYRNKCGLVKESVSL